MTDPKKGAARPLAMKALPLLALVLLGADGGTDWTCSGVGACYRFTTSPDDPGPNSWPARAKATHEGRLPNGTRLVVWTGAGERLVPQPPHVEWAFTVESSDGGARYHTVPVGTELRQLDGGTVNFEAAAGHEHCWHMAPLQHVAAYHRDEYCCHCAAERCVNLAWPGLCGEDHGPRCQEPQLNLHRYPAKGGLR